MHKRLFILTLILILLIFTAVLSQVTEFVYVSPRVKTSVFPYLADVIKPLDTALNDSIQISNKQKNIETTQYQ